MTEIPSLVKEAAMRRYRNRSSMSLVGALVLAWMFLVPAGAGAATRTPVWAHTFVPPNAAVGTSIAMGPAGATLYQGGSTQAAPNRLLVGAYAAATGERRWFRRIPCSTTASDPCWLGSLGVSPDGDTVFVTGADQTGPHALDWVTMALDSATGAPRWVVRLAGGYSGTSRLQVSPIGDRVFVAGSVGTTAHPGERVVAYDAATGGLLWRYRGAGYADVAYLAVSPDGALVFAPPVADRSPSRDMATVALDAATGSTAWVRRSGGKRMSDWPAGLAIDPAGRTVFVVDYREAFRAPIGRAPVTIAYRASDGRHLWTKAEEELGAATAMNISIVTGGGRVFVTDGDWTAARATGSGRLLWTRSTGPGLPWWSYSWQVALSPRADRLFVIDSICDYRSDRRCWLETVALDATTGNVRWKARRGRAAGAGLVVGPSGGRVYVGGWVTDEFYVFLGTLVMAYRA